MVITTYNIIPSNFPCENKKNKYTDLIPQISIYFPDINEDEAKQFIKAVKIDNLKSELNQIFGNEIALSASEVTLGSILLKINCLPKKFFSTENSEKMKEIKVIKDTINCLKDKSFQNIGNLKPLAVKFINQEEIENKKISERKIQEFLEENMNPEKEEGNVDQKYHTKIFEKMQEFANEEEKSLKNDIKNENKNSKNEISKDNEIERLKRVLKEEKEKNKNLENIINNLRSKNNNENENLKKEIKVYKEKIEKMKNDIQKLSLENNNLKDKMKSPSTQNNQDEIVRLYKKIEGLTEKIDELNEKLKRYPFSLEEGEKIMSIIFTSVDEKINYSMICKNTDTINQLELELYKEYPKLGEAEYYFICNGAKVKKIKTLEELKIKSGDVIVLNEVED